MKQLAVLFTMLSFASGAAGAQSKCKQFSFTAEVKAGKPVTRPIGNGLSFGVAPEETNGIHGWSFEIAPTVRTQSNVSNYVFLVTPPYHFRHPTDLSTGYGVPAQDAVAPGGRRRFWFVLSPADAETASNALDHDIWPQNEQDVANAGKIRRNLPKGRGEFVILDSKFTPGEADEHGYCETDKCGSMEWMRFRVTLVVPVRFKVASDLQTTDAACPGPWK